MVESVRIGMSRRLVHGHADAYAQGQFHVVQYQRCGSHSGPEHLRTRCGDLDAALAQEHTELLASQARHQFVRRSESLLQAVGKSTQTGVTSSVAMTIVDGLEMIQIEDQQREWPPARTRLGHPFVQRGLESPAIGQPGQSIAPALLLEQVAL